MECLVEREWGGRWLLNQVPIYHSSKAKKTPGEEARELRHVLFKGMAVVMRKTSIGIVKDLPLLGVMGRKTLFSSQAGKWVLLSEKQAYH